MINEKLKNLRLKHKLTQKELSELTGLSQQHISKIETGKIVPNFRTVLKISSALSELPTFEFEDF